MLLPVAFVHKHHKAIQVFDTVLRRHLVVILYGEVLGPKLFVSFLLLEQLADLALNLIQLYYGLGQSVLNVLN
jgi:hypothetical protein